MASRVASARGWVNASGRIAKGQSQFLNGRRDARDANCLSNVNATRDAEAGCRCDKCVRVSPKPDYFFRIFSELLPDVLSVQISVLTGGTWPREDGIRRAWNRGYAFV